jgi:hypothetical protein
LRMIPYRAVIPNAQTAARPTDGCG